MLNLTISVRAMCDKHPRFNPEKQGESGIRGNCARCLILLDIRRKMTEFSDQVRTSDAIVKIR